MPGVDGSGVLYSPAVVTLPGAAAGEGGAALIGPAKAEGSLSIMCMLWCRSFLMCTLQELCWLWSPVLEVVSYGGKLSCYWFGVMSGGRVESQFFLVYHIPSICGADFMQIGENGASGNTLYLMAQIRSALEKFKLCHGQYVTLAFGQDVKSGFKHLWMQNGSREAPTPVVFDANVRGCSHRLWGEWCHVTEKRIISFHPSLPPGLPWSRNVQIFVAVRMHEYVNKRGMGGNWPRRRPAGKRQ